MKNTKRLLSMVLILVTLVACMFVITSCKDKHEHNYTAEVVPPNCTAQGYTKYTCECGDTYNDNFVAATHFMAPHAAKAPTCTEVGHTAYTGCDGCGQKEGYVEIPMVDHHLVSAIIEYPSVNTAGKKKLSCVNCTYSEEHKIDAFTATLPDVSAFLTEVIKEGEYSLNVKEGSTIVFVTELDEYDEDNNGEKFFLALNLANAEIKNENSVVTGLLEVEFGTASKVIDGSVPAKEVTAPETFDKAGAIEIYLNGNDISISVTLDGVENSQDITVNEVFYSAVAEMLGMTYDDLVTAIYLGNKAMDVIPSAMAIVSVLDSIELPEISDEYTEALSLLFANVAQNIITSETDADGNTIYNVDMEALTALVEAIEGKTVIEFLGEVYGEATVALVVNFISSIPDITVLEMANNVSYVATALGVDIKDAYELVDMILYMNTGVEISVQTELSKNYNKTIADLVADSAVAQNPHANRDDIIATLKSGINTAVATVSNLTVDDIYNMYMTSAGIELPADFSFTAQLKTMIEGLGETVTVTVVVDSEGNFVSLDANLAGTVITVGFETEGLVATLNAFGSTLEVTFAENEFNVYYSNGEYDVLDITLSYSTETELDSTTDVYAFTITDTEDTILNASVTLIDGVFDNAALIVNNLILVDDGEGNMTKRIENIHDVKFSYVVDEGETDYILDVNGMLYVISIYESENELGFMIGMGTEDTMLFGIMLGKVSEIVDGVTTENHTILIMDDENTLFYAGVVFENGVFTGASATMNNYVTIVDETTKEEVQKLQNIFTATVSYTDTGDGEHLIGITFNEYFIMVEFVDNAENNGIYIEVTEDETILATVIAGATIESVTEDEVTTVKTDYIFFVQYGSDILVDFDAISIDGEFISAYLIINGYESEIVNEYDDTTGELISSTENKEFVNFIDVTVSKEENVITLTDNILGETATLEILENGIKITTEDTTVIAKVETTVEEDVVTEIKFTFNVTEGEDVLFNYVAVVENGIITSVTLFAQNYETMQAVDPETGDPIGDPVKVFTTLADYKYSVEFTENGVSVVYYLADNDVVYCDFTIGLSADEDSLTISYDIDKLMVDSVTMRKDGLGDIVIGDYITGPLVPTDKGEGSEFEGDIGDLFYEYITKYLSIEGKGEITLVVNSAE